MNKELGQVLLIVKLMLCVMWPVTAYAAQITFGDNLAHIPPLALAMTFLLSTLAGITALLNSMKNEYEKNGKIDRLWLFISSKMLGSNVAGLLVFFCSETYSITETVEAAAIIIGAFGGTWAIDRALQYYAEKFLPTKGE